MSRDDTGAGYAGLQHLLRIRPDPPDESCWLRATGQDAGLLGTRVPRR